MLKYAIICKIKFGYFEYRYHEAYFCIRMHAIGQSKKNMQNDKHPNPSYNIIITTIENILCLWVEKTPNTL